LNSRIKHIHTTGSGPSNATRTAGQMKAKLLRVAASRAIKDDRQAAAADVAASAVEASSASSAIIDIVAAKADDIPHVPLTGRRSVSADIPCSPWAPTPPTV
jgi:hypothetical protein